MNTQTGKQIALDIASWKLYNTVLRGMGWREVGSSSDAACILICYHRNL
jgi:hypothetical protein